MAVGRMFSLTRFAPLLALAVVSGLPSGASAADWGVTPVVATATPIAGLPTCDDAGTLATIRDRFTGAADRIEHRDLAIASVDAVRETAAGVDAPSPIARRWCTAAVTLSDGTRSTLWWRIDRGTGFAAPGYAYWPDGLEFCVGGHDPWRVHDGECRTVRRWW